MKRVKYLFLILFALLCVNQKDYAYADQKHISSLILQPSVLQEGTSAEICNAPRYEFDADGEEWHQVYVPENGAVVLDISVTNPGFINFDLYDSGSDLPMHLSCQCTGDRGNRNEMTIYLKKGRYYLVLPQNHYEINLYMYSSNVKEIKNNQKIAAYVDDMNCQYIKYKTTNEGYIRLTLNELKNNNSSVSVVLCDSKKNELTTPEIFVNLINQKKLFAVKGKTTYYIKTYSTDTNGSSYFQLGLKYTEKSNNGASKKKKATDIKLGNKCSGLIFAEDSTSREHWFKVKNTKKQKLKFEYSASSSSGGMIIDFYNEKGQKLINSILIDNMEQKGVISLKNIDGGDKLPSGTYYIRVTKNDKISCGIYTIKLLK